MKFGLSFGWALVLAGLAAACAPRTAPPAPVQAWGEAPPRSIAVAAIAPRSMPLRANAVRVQPGDTLRAIARRTGVPVRLLIEINHLTPPYRLEAGQIIVLSAGPVPPPATVAAAAVTPPPRPVHAATPPPRDRNPLLASALPPPKPTATTAVPTAASRIDSSEVPPPEKPVRQRLAMAKPQPPSENSDASPMVGTVDPPAPKPIRAAAAVTAPIPPSAAPRADGFIWPVEGRVVETYGDAANGGHNDGINIAAATGAPVVAAAAGTVIYAGNELRGYGNLILIKHPDGHLTAYAHNSGLLVHRGDHVKRGQVIAKVGATGAVGEPQLHFEIRSGRKAVDPIPLLPPREASAAAS